MFDHAQLPCSKGRGGYPDERLICGFGTSVCDSRRGLSERLLHCDDRGGRNNSSGDNLGKREQPNGNEPNSVGRRNADSRRRLLVCQPRKRRTRADGEPGGHFIVGGRSAGDDFQPVHFFIIVLVIGSQHAFDAEPWPNGFNQLDV